MALQKEIWTSTIQENLFQNQDWLARFVNHDAYVSNKKVHIPNAGVNPSVTKNPSSFPLTPAQRTDIDVEYSLELYALNPFLVTDLEDLQVNYNKRASVIKQQTDVLNDAIGRNSLYAVAPSSASTNGVTRIVRTTGAATNNALASGATGNRSGVTLSDIAKLKGILDNDNVPASGRMLIVPASIYNAQLLAIQDIYQQQSYGQSALPSGVVSRIYGFDIYCVPNVVTYTTGASPSLIAIGDNGIQTTSNTTDNLGILAIHESAVCRALGDISVYADLDKPQYLGSLFNASVLFKAAKLRESAIGIAALVQQ